MSSFTFMIGCIDNRCAPFFWMKDFFLFLLFYYFCVPTTVSKKTLIIEIYKSNKLDILLLLHSNVEF